MVDVGATGAVQNLSGDHPYSFLCEDFLLTGKCVYLLFFFGAFELCPVFAEHQFLTASM